MDALFICFIMNEELKVNILGEDWGPEDLQKLAINMTNQKNAFLNSLNINKFQRKDLDEAISQLSNDITSGNVSGIDFGNYWKFKDDSYVPDKAMRRAMEYANSIIAKRGQKPKENTGPQAFNDNGYRDYLINQGYFTKNDDDTLNFNHLGWRGDDYNEEQKKYITNTAGLTSLARTLTDWQTSLKDQEFDFSKSKFKDRETFDQVLRDAINAVYKTTVKTTGEDGTEIEEEQAADLTNEERAYLYKLGLDDKVINQLVGIGELQTTPSTWRDQYIADQAQWADDDARYQANAEYAMREAGKTWNDELTARQTKPEGWDGRNSYAVDLNSTVSDANITASGKLGQGYDAAVKHLSAAAPAYAQAINDPRYYNIRKTDSQGRFYIPQYTEGQSYYIAYNPKTNTVSVEWYYDDKDYIDEQRTKYLQDVYDDVMDQQRRNTYTSARYNKNGGILNKLKSLKTGGILKADKGRILLPYEMDETQIQQYVDSINKVIERNKVAEELNNQNAENTTKHREDSLDQLTAKQIAQTEYVPSYTTLMHEIGQKRKQAEKNERKARVRNVMYLDAALADLAALIGDVVTVDPVSSLVNSGIGLGSSLTTLTADLMGSETKWYRDFGNFGLNLLGDASVLLPSALGSVGKASKIGSNLKKLIGYSLNGLGWLELVAAVPHSKEILNSFNKMFQGEKMSVEDWRYIYQGLSAVRTGVLKGSTAVKQRKYHTSAQKMQDTYGTADIVQPKYQITTNKNKKYQLTEEELKQLQGKNTVEEANAYLREVTGDLTAQLKVDSKGKHLIPAKKLTTEYGDDPIQFLKDLRRQEGRNPKDKPTITEKTVEYWYTKGSNDTQDDLVELYRRPTNNDTPPVPKQTEEPKQPKQTVTTSDNVKPQPKQELSERQQLQLSGKTEEQQAALQLPGKTADQYLAWASKKGLSQEDALYVLEQCGYDFIKAMADIKNKPVKANIFDPIYTARRNEALQQAQLPLHQRQLTDDQVNDLLKIGLSWDEILSGSRNGLTYDDMVTAAQSVKNLKVKRNGGKFHYMKKLKNGGILKCDKGFDFSRYKKDPSNLTEFDLFKYPMEELTEELNSENTQNSYVNILKALEDDIKRRAILAKKEEEIDTNQQLVNEEILNQIEKDSNEIQTEFNAKFGAPVNPSDEDFYNALSTYNRIKRNEGNKFLGLTTPPKNKYIINQNFSKTASNLGQYILSEQYNKQIHDRNREGIRDKLNADLKGSNPFIQQQYYNDDIFNIQSQNQSTKAAIYDQIIQAQNMGQDTSALINALIDMQTRETGMINYNLNNTRQEWQNVANTNAKSEWQAGLDRAKAFGNAHMAMAEDDINYLQQSQDNASKLMANQSDAQEQQVAYNNALIDQYNTIVDDPTLTPEQKNEYINKLKLKGLRVPNNVGMESQLTWQG